MRVATFAIASSMLLSTTSHTSWWRPRASVEPMYMPGRLRTACRPSRTWMLAAVYSAPFVRRDRRAGSAVMRGGHLPDLVLPGGSDRERGARRHRGAASDDRVDAIELLVGVEVDDEPSATAGAADAHLRRQHAAQLGLEGGEIGGELLEHDAEDGALQLRDRDRGEGAAVALADPPLGDRLARVGAEVEEAQRVAHRDPALADLLRHGLMRHAEE